MFSQPESRKQKLFLFGFTHLLSFYFLIMQPPLFSSAYQPADLKGKQKYRCSVNHRCSAYTTADKVIPECSSAHVSPPALQSQPTHFQPLLTSNRGRNVIWVEAPPKSRVPTVCWFWPDSCPANNTMLRAAPMHKC